MEIESFGLLRKNKVSYAKKERENFTFRRLKESPKQSNQKTCL